MRASSTATATFADAYSEFETAWANPNHTRFELPAVPVNKVLNDRYVVSVPVHLTRTMVWDMERKKAWDPATFIPYVVSQGHSWGRHTLADSAEHFFRSSMQVGWITAERGRVLEEVFIDHASQRILFFGRARLPGEDGPLEAGNHQPLFHVEHAAGGTEDDPLNLWRIVILTKGNDERFEAPFKDMVRRGTLPGFLEIYIKRELRVTLTKI